MNAVLVTLSSTALDGIRNHLFSRNTGCEEAVFLFAESVENAGACHLRCREWFAVPSDGFVHRSRWFLELTDEMRGQLIKRAHDLECSLVELHSHPSQDNACFSWSDLRGFEEFVPHVLWRLPSRPYCALVMTEASFDGLLWPQPGLPIAVDTIELERTRICSTGLTVRHWDEIIGRSPV